MHNEEDLANGMGPMSADDVEAFLAVTDEVFGIDEHTFACMDATLSTLDEALACFRTLCLQIKNDSKDKYLA